MEYCSKCGKGLKNLSGKILHERYCGTKKKVVYQRKSREEDKRFGKAPWNKGLTKHTNKKLKNASLKKTGKPWIPKSEEGEKRRRQKISDTMKKNPNAGGYRKGSGRCVGAWYESSIAGNVYLDSSYELAYAQWLDSQGTQWTKNQIKFPYEWEGRTRFYIPDFYLIDEDVYVEIKGYKTEKDEAKWRDFPYELVILMKKDLVELEILED